MFEGISGKMSSLGNKFPVVNTLMNAIRRRKNRVRRATAALRLAVPPEGRSSQVGYGAIKVGPQRA